MSVTIPSTPEKLPTTQEHVLSYATFMQKFADRHQDDIGELERQLLIHQLDLYASRLLIGRGVILSGVYLAPATTDDEHEDELELEFELTEGIVAGISNGFTVAETVSFEPQASAAEYEHDLYARISEGVGKFVVGHLVMHSRGTMATANHSGIRSTTLHYVGPIHTTDLVVPDLESAPSNLSVAESKAILSTLDENSRNQVRAIELALSGEGDPLTRVLAAARAINTFLAHNDLKPSNILALKNYLAQIFPKELFQKYYELESLPCAYTEGKNGSLTISTLHLPFSQIAFNDLWINKRFFIDKNGTPVTKDNAPNGIFLSATAAITPRGDTINFFLPLRYLEFNGGKVKART